MQVLDKKRLCELVKEVDPAEQLDEDVEDVLLQVSNLVRETISTNFQIADDFIEHTVSQACALAKHRKANNIDVRDVQVALFGLTISLISLFRLSWRGTGTCGSLALEQKSCAPSRETPQLRLTSSGWPSSRRP